MKAVLLFSALIALSSAKDCGDGIVRGVNLGGWLLLEPWITPSIFQEVNVGENKNKIVDEYTYAQYVDPTFYQERLTKHWDEFYQREDLEKLSASGITHIRIPVGYWMIDVSDDEPFPPPPASDDEGMRFYLKRLVGWADELDMKVLLDLHGAPESQNGFDNSGRRGAERWFHSDTGDHTNIDRTIVALDGFAKLFKGWIEEGALREETLWGIELLNEPIGWLDDLWAECRDHFYPNGYDKLRETFSASQTNVSIQQAFRASSDFYGYMEGKDDVILDMHLYHAFGDYWNGIVETPEGWGLNLQEACRYHEEVAGQTLWTVTGEWSLAVTDCQLYLDGGYAEHYKPTAKPETCAYYNSDWSTYTQEYKDFLAQYMAAQMDGYEYGDRGIGWFFWTAKTENNCAPEWDYIFLLDNGVAPSDLCTRQKYCTF